MARPKNTPAAADQPAEDLIALVKDGEILEVHRTCVEDHKRLGWTEAPADEAAE